MDSVSPHFHLLKTPYAAHKCDGPEQVCETTKDELLAMFKQMVRIRRTETEADKLYKQKEIKGFLHLYNGQVLLHSFFEFPS